MLDFEDQVGDKDLSNDRKFVLDKNTLHVRKKDPYGFWECAYERGPVPEELSGSFTTFDEARKVIEAYLQRTKKDVKEVVTKD